MFGLTFEKLLLIGVIAAFIIGPDKLPQAAEQLARAVHWVRGQADSAKGRLREEMGEEFDDIDWKQLDPRQYDPRRIIRDALLEDLPPATPAKKKPTKSERLAQSAAARAAEAPAEAGAAAGVTAAVASSSRPAWASEGSDEVAASQVELGAPFDSEAT